MDRPSDELYIEEYIEILMNNAGNISQSVYDRIEHSMRNLLTRLRTVNDLCLDEYLFLILCFEDRLYVWANMCDEGSGGNGNVDPDSDSIDFDYNFYERICSVHESAIRNRWENEEETRRISKLSKNLSDIVSIYKEAKRWMIEKGYNI